MIRRVACLAAVLALLACDVSIGSLAGRASDEWTRSYKLSPGGEFRIRNTNGRIDVEGGDDPSVEVRAERIARAVSDEAARELLPRIAINEDVKPDRVSIETGRLSGIMIGAGFEVRYHVRAPKSVVVNVSNTNGQITLRSLSGRVTAHTTNGGVRGNALSGGVDATTTNGGVDVEFASVGTDRISLTTTNGGVTIDLPADAKADVLATCTNGGISVSPDVKMQVTEQSRRRFEGKMNGGGTPVDLRTTNGGIRIRSRGLAEKTTESR
ncbi:MAG: hypothetical protein DMG00_10050 [Acidobacteria bacterium]|nr:MAG: hypothetical protein DMG00_10050 [Acidobacteriota bacterium]